MPATPSSNLTTLGFFYEENRFEIVDNTPTHTSALFQSRLAGWRTQGLYIQYIPAYCPELNLIGCLWKQPGGRCHQISLAESIEFSTPASLRSGLEAILEKIGTKYRITFASLLDSEVPPLGLTRPLNRKAPASLPGLLLQKVSVYHRVLFIKPTSNRRQRWR